jgi:hypothetical protein
MAIKAAAGRHGRAAGLAGLGLAALLGGCGGGGGTGSDPAAPDGARAAELRRLVDTLLNQLQSEALHRARIDWPALRAATLERLGSAPGFTQAEAAMAEALSRLQEPHSYIIRPGGSMLFARPPGWQRPVCAEAGGGRPALPADIGYVRVSGNNGGSQAGLDEARAIQRQIAEQDRPGLAGWIVDLRANGGGNMYPMVAGLGPLLGDGVAGYFVAPDGGRVAWSYAAGAASVGGTALLTVPQPYQMQQPAPRVAVLSDCGNGSSGEATLISFIGRPAPTRLFGTPSYGVSTAVRGIGIGQGYSLGLAVSTMADRLGRPYGERVPVDEPIDDAARVVERAVQWLREP